MRRVVFLMFAVAGFVSAESVRVATFNLDNYLVMNRHVDGKWRPSYPKPESEKSAIRQAILSVKPDVLILQEMGDVAFLEELRADLMHEGRHYTYAVHFEAEDEERHLAVLSSLPPQNVQKHTDLDFKYFDRREKVKRGLLEMTFALPDESGFKLFAVHLKSRWTVDKLDPQSELRRTKEAEACRERIIERTADLGVTRYCVAGDFNADPNSAAMRRFYKRGQLRIGGRVPAFDSRGHVWTHFYRKHSVYSTVDGFVASPAMMKSITDGVGRIWEPPNGQSGSDHRLVYMDVEYETPSQEAN